MWYDGVAQYQSSALCIMVHFAWAHLGAEQVLPDMRPAMMYASGKGSVPYPA